MIKKKFWQLAALATSLGASAVAQAATLQGIDLDGVGSTYEAYFDPVQNLSWLADTTGGTGAMYWATAMAYVANLNVDGVTGWRLPTTPQIDPTCQYNPVTGPSYGFGCTGSELGRLHATYGISADTPGPFNYQGHFGQISFYWSSTTWASEPDIAFTYIDGGQSASWTVTAPGQTRNVVPYFAWAVHDGNLGAATAVPEPGSWALFALGLVVMTGAVRRRRQ